MTNYIHNTIHNVNLSNKFDFIMHGLVIMHTFLVYMFMCMIVGIIIDSYNSQIPSDAKIIKI